ncbi:MAG: hypothetical protein MJ233_05235 [Mycoplasmoidaceae bacterium]|nr:hypothetical protein [Mycoplasmoidaceae bacterium]
MEDALSMKDVEYLQLSSDYETIDRVLGTLHSEKTIDDMIISPSSSYYHNQYYDITDPVKPIIKSASETYQIKNDETFTAYSRNFLISIN